MVLTTTHNKPHDFNKADLTGIRHFWNLITTPGEVRELRVPKTTQGTISGYFDNAVALGSDAAKLSGSAAGVYMTINPVKPELLARSSNRIKPYADFAVSDTDIITRQFILIDIDPVRPSGISSTDAEQHLSFELADRIEAYMISQGCPADSLIKISTGNGAAFWFHIDLPNNKDSTALVNRFLESLDFQFSDNTVHIDTSVYNAARIAKIPGTMACKGENTIDRPHRLSAVLKLPDTLSACPAAVINDIASRLPVKPPKSPGNNHKIDVAEWLAEHSISIIRVKEWNGARVYEIPCQWNPEHNRGEAYVIQFDNGATVAGCHHNSCQDKTWANLRELKEPGYREHLDNRLNHIENPGNRILTDTTNAELIAELYGDRLRYDHLRGRWLLWAGHYWQEDLDGEVYRLAIQAARERHRRSVEIEDLKERQRVSNWAIASEQRMRLEAAVSLTKNTKPVADNGKDWDSDPWLFAVANGVIDLRTGWLRNGKQEDRITMHSNVVYDHQTKCPRWMQFLSEIFNDDEELIDWVWRNLGYAMTGITSEQIFMDGYGTGANGKGRFQGILRGIFGDYAYDAPFSTFELNFRASIPNDLAALERRRLVTSSETNDGTRLNEARIKALSGEDPCTARYLHQEFFTFKPICKIWLFVNHKPVVKDDSYGFWRRVRLIPFLRQFKGENEDKNLFSKLLADAPGILNWLIAGCLEWQKRGLVPAPAAVVSATESYKIESDPLAQFIADACIENPNAQVRAIDLYRAYGEWADEQGLRDKERLSNTAFGRRIAERVTKSHTKGGWIYQGVGLLEKGDTSVTGFGGNSYLGDGLGGNFNVLSHENPRTGKNVKNPSNPSPEAKNPSPHSGDPPTDEIIKLWQEKGRPPISLRSGEKCNNLEALLQHPIRESDSVIIKQWYESQVYTEVANTEQDIPRTTGPPV